VTTPPVVIVTFSVQPPGPVTHRQLLPGVSPRSGRVEQVTNGDLGHVAQRSLEPHQGMVAHIRPSISFSKAQPLGLVELEVGIATQVPSRLACELPPAAAFSPWSSKSENRVACPLFLFRASADKCPLDDSLELARQSPLRGWPSESKPPAFTSDSDSSLVERARIDPATEVVEVDERALTLAGGDDVLDNGLPDIADRGKAEDDHLPATRGRGLG